LKQLLQLAVKITSRKGDAAYSLPDRWAVLCE